MDGPTDTALRRYQECIAAMLADPDLYGDLLLIGVVLAGRSHLGHPPTSSGLVFGPGTGSTITGPDGVTTVVYDSRRERWQRAMRRDIRRYSYEADPAYQRNVLCGAPMIRRAGSCGKSATRWSLATDLDTGRRLQVGACSRHAAWYDDETTRRSGEATARKASHQGVPVPPANTGGVLRRHLPGFDWPDLWRRLDERWVEPPEAEPFIPPVLTLHINDDLDPDPGATSRPRLTLITTGEPRS